MRCCGCASSIPRLQRWSSAPRRNGCSARGRTSACWVRHRTPARSPSASSPTRPAARSRTRARTRGSATSARSGEAPREAATNSRSPRTGFCSSTTARARCRFPRCPRSACCREPGAWCAWSTSARCAGTAPTSSRPPRRGYGARGRSNGDWWTRSRSRRASRRWWNIAPGPSRRRATGRRRRAGSASGRSSAGSKEGASRTHTSKRNWNERNACAGS